jgi:hypothetical protein
MAPEILLDKDYDEKADVYSFCTSFAVLYLYLF